MGLEIERKFLVKRLPRNYGQYPHKVIRQGYRGSLGLRAEYDPPTLNYSYFITIKTGSGKVRGRFGTEIDTNQFSQLWPVVEKKIAKLRYFLPFRDKIIELNFFMKGLEGL